MKTVQWEPRCSMRTESQGIKPPVAVRNFANAPKDWTLPVASTSCGSEPAYQNMAWLPYASALQRKQRAAVTAVPLPLVTPSNNPTTKRPVTKSPLFRRTQNFVALLTTARHWSLSRTRFNQFRSSYPIILWSSLILFFHLRSRLSSVSSLRFFYQTPI